MIGTTAALLFGGASLLGAGASIMSGKSAAKAAKNAANENNALAREQYDSNKVLLTPYINRGNTAADALMGELHLGPNPANALARPKPQAYATSSTGASIPTVRPMPPQPYGQPAPQQGRPAPFAQPQPERPPLSSFFGA